MTFPLLKKLRYLKFKIMNKFFYRIKKFFYIEKWKKNKKSWPSKKQWLSFLKVISKPERIFFIFFLCLAIISGIGWWRVSFLAKTKKVPKNGGIITETIIGQPQSLNPLLAPLNDADRDISYLLYAGLLKYDKEGNLKEDLAEKYEVSPDGKVYTFFLKDNLLWSDGKKIIADDIIFAFATLQNPETQSPLRILFQGVKIEKIDDKTIRFTLDNPYPSFIENLTFGIIPQHIFKNITPSELSSILPKEFAVSGPFKIKKIEKNIDNEIKSVSLERNDKYYGASHNSSLHSEFGASHNSSKKEFKKPYLDGINLIFVENEDDFLKRKGKSTSLAEVSVKNKDKIEKRFNIYSLSTPRYFALFLNQENKVLAIKEVKEAMALSTPKDEIINKVFFKKARRVDGPFLPENNIGGDYKKYNFDINTAKDTLEKNNWQDTNNDGIREKVMEEGQNAIPLQFTLFTVDQKELNSVAKIIQENWEKAGIKIEIQSLPPQELLQNIIKERKYDILLFGQGLMMIPEPYSFWHSSQIKYPGLNLSLYKNNDIDKLLDSARKETDSQKRIEAFQTIQQKIAEDLPAIFLYSPDYLYAVKKNVKGIETKYIIDPSKRFTDIESWYIKEKRIPKTY